MSSITYKVDLDYESYLFDSNYTESSPANLKIIKEFEYVFFLINREEATLKNSLKYESSYLDKLKSLGYIIPKFDPFSKNYTCWWGNHHDIELEKKLNSKLTSANLAKINKWGFFKGAIVEHSEDLKLHLLKYPEVEKWILKRPNSFSGIGHNQITAKTDEAVLKKIITEKNLLEPVYDRLFDIGTTFRLVDGKIISHFMVENFNSISGAFKGGAGSSSVEKFKKYILKKYNYSLDHLEKISFDIAKAYQDLGATGNIQIDSFVYHSPLNPGELELYALVEVNYRKTMGLVIDSLANIHKEADWVEWRIENKKTLTTNLFGPEWTMVSPPGNHFQSYFKPMYFS